MNSTAVGCLNKGGCEGGGLRFHLDCQTVEKTSLSDHITTHLVGDVMFAVNSLLLLYMRSLTRPIFKQQSLY